MSVHAKYNQIKQKAQNYRSTILSKIYQSRFNTMLDAFTKSSQITSTINSLISLTVNKFNVFGNPIYLIKPSGSTANPNSSRMTYVRPYWTGSLSYGNIENVNEPYIPIPEFALNIPSTPDVSGAIKTNIEILSRKVFLKEPFRPASRQYYNAFDLDYGYVYPDTIIYIGHFENINISNPKTLNAWADVSSMLLIEQAIVTLKVTKATGDVYFLRISWFGVTVYLVIILNAITTIEVTRDTETSRRAYNLPYVANIYLEFGYPGPEACWLVLPDGCEVSVKDSSGIGVWANLVQYNDQIGFTKVGTSLSS